MKKLFKILLSATLAAALSFSLALTAFAAGSYIKYAGYTFSLTDGLAGIHDYDGGEKELYIPETIWGYPVVGIDNSAFFGRTEFTDLYLHDSKNLKTIGSKAFYGCSGIPYAEIPPSVETIGDAAFQSCTALREIEFNNNKLTELPTQLCYGCTSLEEIAIPASVTTIGAYAFGGCSALTKVEIPDSVTEIDPDAFTGSGNVVIYASNDSCAIAYARARGISYVITDTEPVTYLRGDADGDEEVTIIDVTCIQRYLAGIAVSFIDEKAADVDGNELDIVDATLIQRYLAGLNNPYHIDEIVTENA